MFFCVVNDSLVKCKELVLLIFCKPEKSSWKKQLLDCLNRVCHSALAGSRDKCCLRRSWGSAVRASMDFWIRDSTAWETWLLASIFIFYNVCCCIQLWIVFQKTNDGRFCHGQMIGFAEIPQKRLVKLIGAAGSLQKLSDPEWHGNTSFQMVLKKIDFQQTVLFWTVWNRTN